MKQGVRQVWIAVLLGPALAAGAAWAEAPSGDETVVDFCARLAGLTPLATPAVHPPQTYEDCLDLVYSVDATQETRAQARRCCEASGDCFRELAMMHANGWGGPRDLDLAAVALCRAEDEMAPAEWEGMLEHLERMRKGEEKDELHFCDHVTSGRGSSFCASVALQRNYSDLNKLVAQLGKSIPQEALPALEELNSKAFNFAQNEALLGCEVNRGGTAYGSFCMGYEMAEAERFGQLLRLWTENRRSDVSVEQAKQSDAELNAVYKQLRKAMSECSYCAPGENNFPELLRTAQLDWIRYRDAWATYYALRWKGQAAEEELRREIVHALTHDRAAALTKVLREEWSSP